MNACRAQRTADEERDSHPRRCSFPRGLHLRLYWHYASRLQFKAQGPDFQAELIPVHSPLLRESCLVSCPPLTYMLKFSGFSDLTSCHVWVKLACSPNHRVRRAGWLHWIATAGQDAEASLIKLLASRPLPVSTHQGAEASPDAHTLASKPHEALLERRRV